MSFRLVCYSTAFATAFAASTALARGGPATVRCAGVDASGRAVIAALSADRRRLALMRGAERPKVLRIVEIQDWSRGDRYVTRRGGYLEFGADSTVYVYKGESVALTCD